MDYSAIPDLADIYLEDSYVLGIQDTEDGLIFRMDFVLRESHPKYVAPRHGEAYCYHIGKLRFGGGPAKWIRRVESRAIDAHGEVDLGNIDRMESTGSQRWKVEGEFGEVEAYGAPEVIVE